MATAGHCKTLTKTRGFAGNKLVLRLDCETRVATLDTVHDLSLYLFEFMRDKDIQCVVMSDYNKGIFQPWFVETLLKYCSEHQIFTVVDPKKDAEKYRGCTMIKPNYSEAVALTGLPKGLPLQKYHEKLHEMTGCLVSCITRAEEGMSIYDHREGVPRYQDPLCKREYEYAQPRVEVHDVTGAGDIVCATIAYHIAKGMDLRMMVKVATFLATQSVRHAGSYVLQPEDFWALKKTLFPSKVIRQEDLMYIPRNKKIVFTNGCFDLFHAGHAKGLKSARQLGDCLVVGVNSDASIQGNKGPERPICSLQDRLGVLEALECVDYLVVFEEETPEALLEMLRPDVYVKGSEYEGMYLPGSQYANRVQLIPREEFLSTTELVRRIRTPLPKPVL
jgi:D-beta-D-heptose 7-phosphate kinase/D-beta-D-heptose 1-phosphate adenosyltransferase